MNVSIASYSFHGLLAEGKMDVFGYLETIRYRYQTDAADIWNGMLPTTDKDYIRKVREALDEKELVLANLCVDGAHPWDPDPDERERLHRNALAHLRVGAILGAKTVRIDLGGKGEEWSDEAFDTIVARYSEYAQFAADHGFKVGPETHWGPSLVWENMEKVCDAVGSPAYGILLHVGHWNHDPDESDRKAAPLAVHTHVDANVTATCLEEKMRMMLDAGYDGYWGVEHHSARNEYAEVEWQIATVRRAARRLAAGL